MQARTLTSLTAAAGAAALGYAVVVERNWFTLRRYTVPVLPPGTPTLRLLHISDTHLTPGRRGLAAWLRALDELDPDLVINTGDSIAHPQAVTPFLDALGPLLDRPGAFVLGSNDLFSPKPKNPARYLWRTSAGEHTTREIDMPWEQLRDSMAQAGWLDLNNQRGKLSANGLEIALAGVHDAHIGRDRYERVAGQADAGATLRIGVLHSPEPSLLDRFTADGYELLLAGHTHGGQLRLPGYGALVTNCGIDRARVRGLHRHPPEAAKAAPGTGTAAGSTIAGDTGQAWLHVSAGLGTSPWAPARFACRPEATLLTLVAQDPVW